MTGDGGKKLSVRVDFDRDSSDELFPAYWRYFWQDGLKIDIRDASLRFVASITGREGLDGLELPEGFYQFSTVLHSGQEVSQLVNLRPDHSDVDRVIIFSADDLQGHTRKNQESPTPSTPKTNSIPFARDSDFIHALPVIERINLTRILEREKILLDIGTQSIPTTSYPPSAPEKNLLNYIEQYRNPRLERLLSNLADSSNVPEFDADEAINRKITEYGWQLTAASYAFAGVPMATLANNKRIMQISLPLFPDPESSSCDLIVEPDGTHEISIASSNMVASGLLNMLKGGHYLHAAHVARQAHMMLFEKYEDPVAATLGALVLQKTGALGTAPYDRWLRNLARSFEWLPDGKILLAQILMDRLDLESGRNREKKSELKKLLEQASKQRVLFTECFSMMHNLVRLWPWEGLHEKRWRKKILHRLAPIAASLDWRATFVTTLKKVTAKS